MRINSVHIMHTGKTDAHALFMNCIMHTVNAYLYTHMSYLLIALCMHTVHDYLEGKKSILICQFSDVLVATNFEYNGGSTSSILPNESPVNHTAQSCHLTPCRV